MTTETAPVAAGPGLVPERVWTVVAWTVGLWCATVGAPLIAADRWLTGHTADALLQPLLMILPLVGALVAAKRPHNPVGWLLLGAGVAAAVGLLADGGRVALVGTEASPLGALLSQSAFAAGLPLLLLALLLFPDGRAPSRRWRPVVAVLAAAAGVKLLLAWFGPWPDELYPGLSNPWAVAPLEPLAGPAFMLALTVTNLGIPVTAIAFGLRYRRASAEQRAQLQWVLLPLLVAGVTGIGLLVVSMAGQPPVWAEQLMLVPLVLGVPAGAAVGILRHRLLDIELLLNRTLTYAVVWLGLICAYAATLVVLGQVMSSRAGWLPPFAATVLLVAAFHPLKMRIQRLVDRWLFGHRSDPYEVMVRLDRSASGDSQVAEIGQHVVDTLASALRLPYVALTRPDGTRVEHGRPVRYPPVEIPLMHAGEDIGCLTVAGRSPGERFRKRERRLLEDMAIQAAVALRAATAAEGLREARRRIVGAVEEERRRLRREMHDGVGARLTGLGFTVRAARNRLDQPLAAAELLDQVSEDLQQTITEVRGLVHELRPPALDDLGLVAAIEQRVRRLCEGAGVTAEVAAPDELPALAASVETAVYRVAVEACTNVVRHAGASRCSVRLHLADELVLEVADDGRGFSADAIPGVGLAAMRERVEEVGGMLEIHSEPAGGSTVRAVVPLEAERRHP